VSWKRKQKINRTRDSSTNSNCFAVATYLCVHVYVHMYIGISVDRLSGSLRQFSASASAIERGYVVGSGKKRAYCRIHIHRDVQTSDAKGFAVHFSA
jgi:hypothetical protein